MTALTLETWCNCRVGGIEHHRRRLLRLARSSRGEGDDSGLRARNLRPVGDGEEDTRLGIAGADRAFGDRRLEPGGVRRHGEREGSGTARADVNEAVTERNEGVERDGGWRAVVAERALVGVVTGPSK